VHQEAGSDDGPGRGLLVVETVTADWDWSISTGTAGKAARAFCQRNSE
jgi:hypothetical protein